MHKLFAFVFLLLASSVVRAQHSYEAVLAKYPDFNGVALVANQGRIAFAQAQGTAERQLGVPIRLNSRFKICSITKTFTAVLILQLHEQGLLALTDPIGKFLPEYQGEAASKVNIHHLLTYSSGIPNCEQGRGLEVYQVLVPVDTFINRYCSAKLAAAPGTQFDYDNGAYIILGRIIERITKQPFGVALQQNILKPLGMHNTGFMSDGALVEGLIPSYLYDEQAKAFRQDPPYFIQNYFASAAMYATAEDLLRFDQALFQGTALLKPATKALMLKAYPELYNVAYGFWVSQVQIGTHTTTAADRQGAIQGSNTTWLHLIPENKTVIVLSNTNSTDLNQLRSELLKVSLGQSH